MNYVPDGEAFGVITWQQDVRIKPAPQEARDLRMLMRQKTNFIHIYILFLEYERNPSFQCLLKQFC